MQELYLRPRHLQYQLSAGFLSQNKNTVCLQSKHSDYIRIYSTHGRFMAPRNTLLSEVAVTKTALRNIDPLNQN